MPMNQKIQKLSSAAALEYMASQPRRATFAIVITADALDKAETGKLHKGAISGIISIDRHQAAAVVDNAMLVNREIEGARWCIVTIVPSSEDAPIIYIDLTATYAHHIELEPHI
jgi:hypothetical protein